MKLIEVENLKKNFPLYTGFFSKLTSKVAFLRAVDGVNFSINKKEILGLVGESGCGKSTIAKLILLLYETTEGKIIFDGQNICKISQNEIMKFRRNAQMIFQDAQTSLNRNKTVGKIIADPLEIHKIYDKKEIRERVSILMELVGLSPKYIHRYPHEFSGGQKQRIGIARALSLNPKFIVADEPVSSLDVSAQAQIINLLIDLQEKYDLTYLFVSHDLSLVSQICDRVIVMYLGKFVEICNAKKLFRNPVHPYTKSLMEAVPVPDPLKKKKRFLIEGEIAAPIGLQTGCSFYSRCKFKRNTCIREQPEIIEVEDQHWVACHFSNSM
jgi:oligopeptide/dipeptide ABC transporter ATP-binding protein